MNARRAQAAVFLPVLTGRRKKLFVERIRVLLTWARFYAILDSSNERDESIMEYILKCGKKTFTGDSVSDVEMEFISWVNEQDNFIVDNYTILTLHESPFGEVRAEVEKSTVELLNKGNYIYVDVAERDDDDAYEESYHNKSAA